MTSSDLITTTKTGVLEARLHNFRAVCAAASARLGKLLDESRVGEHRMSAKVEDEIARVQAALDMAVDDDVKAANPG